MYSVILRRTRFTHPFPETQLKKKNSGKEKHVMHYADGSTGLVEIEGSSAPMNFLVETTIREGNLIVAVMRG